MKFIRENRTYFWLFVIIGALAGGALGQLFGELIPALSFLKKNLTGFIGINLDFLQFQVRLSLSALIGIIAGIFIYTKA